MKPSKRITAILLTAALIGGSAAAIPSGTVYAKDNTQNVLQQKTDSFLLPEITRSEQTELSSKATAVKTISESQDRNEKKTVSFTLSFETDGAGSIRKISVQKGMFASEPDTPAKTGFVFAGWYSDKKLKNRFDFRTDRINGNMTLYAKWIPEQTVQAELYNTLEGVEIGYGSGNSYFNVVSDIVLPSAAPDNTPVSWSSSRPDLITADGKVKRPQGENADVVLTAAVSDGRVTETKSFELTVVGIKNETPVKEKDVESIIEMNKNNDDADIIYCNDSKDSPVAIIEGSFCEEKVDDSEDALKAVQAIGSVIGLDSPADELSLFYTDRNEYGSVFKFDQCYKGVKVYGRKLAVSVDQEGKTDWFDSDIVPTEKLRNISTVPSITAENAETAARKLFEGVSNVKKPEIIIYTTSDDERQPVLSYRFDIIAQKKNGAQSEYTVFINAETGKTEEIISVGESLDEEENVIGSGNNLLGKKVSFKLQAKSNDNNVKVYYMRDTDNHINMRYYNPDTKKYRIYSGNNLSKWDADAVSAYKNVLDVHTWYENKLKWKFYENYQKDLNIALHRPEKYDNSVFSHASAFIFFYDNSEKNSNLRPFAACYDVAAHEYTHGVVYKVMGDMSYSNDYRGAINEGLADVFGAFVDGNWQHAEDRKVSRDASDPDKCKNPVSVKDDKFLNPADFSDTNGYSKVAHRDGYILFRAAYLMASNQKAPISIEKQTGLWYEAMKMGSWGVKSDFIGVRRKLIAAAKKRKFTDSQLSTIRSAFDSLQVIDERGTLKIELQDSRGTDITLSGKAEYTFKKLEKGTPQPTKTRHGPSKDIIQIGNLYEGSYSVKVKLRGYKELDTKLLVYRNCLYKYTLKLQKDEREIVRGRIVRDSGNDQIPVSKVNVNIYESQYNVIGKPVKSTVTNDSGEYSVKLNWGNYIFVFEKDGYVSVSKSISVTEGSQINDIYKIKPKKNNESTYYVELNWTDPENIKYDFDLHLEYITKDGEKHEIWYDDSEYKNENGIILGKILESEDGYEKAVFYSNCIDTVKVKVVISNNKLNFKDTKAQLIIYDKNMKQIGSKELAEKTTSYTEKYVFKCAEGYLSYM